MSENEKPSQELQKVLNDVPSAADIKAQEALEKVQKQVEAEKAKQRAAELNAKKAAEPAPTWPNLLGMFDQGSPEHAAMSLTPYLKSLDNEITNLSQQRNLLEQRLNDLHRSRTHVQKTIAELFVGDGHVIKGRYE